MIPKCSDILTIWRRPPLADGSKIPMPLSPPVWAHAAGWVWCPEVIFSLLAIKTFSWNNLDYTIIQLPFCFDTEKEPIVCKICSSLHAEYYAPNLWDRWRNMTILIWPNWRHNWRTRRGRQGSCIQGRLCSLCVFLAATDFSRSAKLVCNHIILPKRVQCHWFCFGLAVKNSLWLQNNNFNLSLW